MGSRSLGEGLDEVVAGLLAMMGRAVGLHMEAEVGFGCIALLFGHQVTRPNVYETNILISQISSFL